MEILVTAVFMTMFGRAMYKALNAAWPRYLQNRRWHDEERQVLWLIEQYGILPGRLLTDEGFAAASRLSRRHVINLGFKERDEDPTMFSWHVGRHDEDLEPYFYTTCLMPINGGVQAYKLDREVVRLNPNFHYTDLP